ncbi:hypothetical protein [Glacieibacterium sp.]|uniref:hypothetical protein n=1 Tax=Glacieibacterium sp. TaxID=2860237 RepID=UPI003AFFAF2E
MLLTALACIVALAVTALLSFGPLARSTGWKATVTPLASIIGSGFLICGPLLAREFGAAALPAMAVLLALAYAVGAVIRFNIIHVENHAATLTMNDRFAWAMRVGQFLLAIAYSVSVAYFLKLLAEFVLKSLPFELGSHALVANALVTAIIVGLTLLTFSGDLKRIEHAAHATVAVKIGIIAGLLTGLGFWWAGHSGVALDLPPAAVSFASLPLLLGLLITVQGFETSRYLGASYDQATRVRTMRYAQWLSSAIYLAFLALLTPFLGRAAQAEGVAGILDIMALVGTGHGGVRARRRRLQPAQRRYRRFDRLGRADPRSVAPKAFRADGVRRGQRAGGGGGLADRPVRGHRPVVARLRVVLCGPGGIGVLGRPADASRLAAGQGRFRRRRTDLSGGRAGRRTGRGVIER